jgi:hypothetical protein
MTCHASIDAACITNQCSHAKSDVLEAIRISLLAAPLAVGYLDP